MAEWCAENLRECEGWRAAGLELSTTSNESARLLDGALRQLVSWRDNAQLGGLSQTMQKMIAADEDAVLARVFTVGLHAMGSGSCALTVPLFNQQVTEMELLAEKCGNDREKKHAKAVALFARGYLPEAEQTWEEILSDHPNDLLAIKFAHDSYFFSGNSRGKRDSVGRVIQKWREDEPMRSYLFGMHAFGLEECGDYADAEKAARTALSLRREDCWATHALAHVFEMQGRNSEGARHMDSTVRDWEPCYMLACHNFWHRSLFAMDDGEYETALSLFDNEIGRRSRDSEGMLDIVDAASLLWRLELEGVNVGKERWRSLPSLTSHLHEHSLIFNDVHFGMILKKSGQQEEEKTLCESLHKFVKNGPANNNQKVCAAIGESLYEGMQAFADEDYERSAKKLLSIRKQIFSIGGSHAQNDVFVQTMLHACILSGDEKLRSEAVFVLDERDSFRLHSGLALRMRKRLQCCNL